MASEIAEKAEARAAEVLADKWSSDYRHFDSQSIRLKLRWNSASRFINRSCPTMYQRPSLSGAVSQP